MGYRLEKRELQQERRAALERAKQLVREAGSRPFTTAQEQEYDALSRKIDLLTTQIRTEYDEEPRPIIDQAKMWGIGKVDLRDEPPDPSGRWKELRHDETAFAMAKRRGWENPAHAELEDLSLGAYLRAVYTGQPRNELERRALSEGTDTAGGHTVPAPLSARLIDHLRNELVIVRAGARTVPMASESLKFAVLGGDAGFSWVAEGSTAAVVDPIFGAVTLTPKTFRGIIQASEELVMDSINLDTELERVMVAAMAVEIDRVALVGSSTAGEPVGIRNSTGVPLVDARAGSTAAAVSITDYDDLVVARQNMRAANVRPIGGQYAAIAAPRSVGELGMLKATDNQPLVPPPILGDVPLLETAGVPVNLSSHGSTGDGTELFVGDYGRMLLGMRLDPNVRILRERYADRWRLGFLASLRMDVGLEKDVAFRRIVGYHASTL